MEAFVINIHNNKFFLMISLISYAFRAHNL